jgi:hypothetical protein
MQVPQKYANYSHAPIFLEVKFFSNFLPHFFLTRFLQFPSFQVRSVDYNDYSFWLTSVAFTFYVRRRRSASSTSRIRCQYLITCT